MTTTYACDRSCSAGDGKCECRQFINGPYTDLTECNNACDPRANCHLAMGDFKNNPAAATCLDALIADTTCYPEADYRKKENETCAVCTGNQQHKFRMAGCTNEMIVAYCESPNCGCERGDPSQCPVDTRIKNPESCCAKPGSLGQTLCGGLDGWNPPGPEGLGQYDYDSCKGFKKIAFCDWKVPDDVTDSECLYVK